MSATCCRRVASVASSVASVAWSDGALCPGAGRAAPPEARAVRPAAWQALGQALGRLPHLPARAAFYLQASITVSFLAGSSAPTPLYALYQGLWGFSSTMLTLAFGIYALAVLATLLVAGRVSDHLGRRPVLMIALAAQVAAMAVLGRAGGLTDLLLGRVIQGLAVGAAVAAVGAGLLDLDKARGAVANSVAPMLGTAAGGVIAGLMVQYLPAPLHLVYLALAGVFVLQGLGVALMAETAPRQPGAWASLVPRLTVGTASRWPLWRAAPVLVAVWALAGFHASLGPALLRQLSRSNSIALGGVALFVLAGSGALSVLALHRQTPDALVRVGTWALLVGLSLSGLGVATHSVGGFLVGTAVAGIGFGSGFQGALRSVVASSATHERAGILSALFVVSYGAMGVPAVAAGYGLTHGGDIVVTAGAFASAVMVLAVAALATSRGR